MREHGNENPSLIETLGGEIREGWDATSRLPQRLVSFDQLKHRTREFVEWARAGGVSFPAKGGTFDDAKNRRLFRALDGCAEYVLFRQYLVSERSRLLGACTCKRHLLCAFCASRRGVRNSMAYKVRVDRVCSDRGDLDLVLLTFTVKNGPGLMERFEHLRRSMQFLLKRRNRELKGGNRQVLHTEMARLSGGVFAYEFKRGAAGQWHPHIHMLALAPKGAWLDLDALKAEWLEVTGDSHVVNVKKADDGAFLEVFAYALKFSEMEHPDRWFAFNELSGERLISSFGVLRQVELVESEADELLDSDEPFVDVLFKWCTVRGYLHEKNLLPSKYPPL